jgi:UPF0271 protein
VKQLIERAKTVRVDLNSDVGESFGHWKLGDDAGVLDAVSSANVACGFHAGDPGIMRATCRMAANLGVAVGAHVGYRDLAGFGRRFIDMDANELTDEIVYQIGALQALAAVEGVKVQYVKPHGGLYNTTVHHSEQAQAVVDAVRVVGTDLAILGLPGSELLRIADGHGLRAVTEAFADRAYNSDGTLVSRMLSGAVLTDPTSIASRVVRIVTRSEVVAIDGSVIPIDAESVCLHGDTPGAVAIARSVREALVEAGVEIGAFS